MFIHLRMFIQLATKEAVRMNMPQVFKDLYPQTRCTIDCSEILILLSDPVHTKQEQKLTPTIKSTLPGSFFIGITPNVHHTDKSMTLYLYPSIRYNGQ